METRFPFFTLPLETNTPVPDTLLCERVIEKPRAFSIIFLFEICFPPTCFSSSPKYLFKTFTAVVSSIALSCDVPKTSLTCLFVKKG